MFELHKYGGPKIRSISVACTAALTRTASTTVTEWPDWVRQMHVSFNEFSAIKHLRRPGHTTLSQACRLYTSDAADEPLCVDLGGRRIIKKKKNKNHNNNNNTRIYIQTNNNNQSTQYHHKSYN